MSFSLFGTPILRTYNNRLSGREREAQVQVPALLSSSSLNYWLAQLFTGIDGRTYRQFELRSS